MADYYRLHDIVMEIADGALGILVPKLSEEHRIALHKPSLNTSVYEYMGGYAGTFSPLGDYGFIKLEENVCNSRLNCCAVTSHELGHASIYQNFPDYVKLTDEDKKGCFHLLGEGVSEKFMKEGLSILVEEGYISALGYCYKSLGHLFWRGIVRSVLLPDEYTMGEMVIDSYARRGVKIRDIITRPDEFKEDLEKRELKSMVRFYSRPSMKVLEKICEKLR